MAHSASYSRSVCFLYPPRLSGKVSRKGNEITESQSACAKHSAMQLTQNAVRSAAPHAPTQALDTGRSMRRADGRGLSAEEVQDWKHSSEYRQWRRTDAVVKWFWQLVEGWRPARRAMVLQLATGTASAPPGGFDCLMGHSIAHSDAPCRCALLRPPVEVLGCQALQSPHRFWAAGRSLLGASVVETDMNLGCRFTICKLQPRQWTKSNTQTVLPKGFLPLNRLYLPE